MVLKIKNESTTSIKPSPHLSFYPSFSELFFYQNLKSEKPQLLEETAFITGPSLTVTGVTNTTQNREVLEPGQFVTR